MDGHVAAGEHCLNYQPPDLKPFPNHLTLNPENSQSLTLNPESLTLSTAFIPNPRTLNPESLNLSPKPSSSSLLFSSLELSDTKVYAPYIRALLGTDKFPTP